MMMKKKKERGRGIGERIEEKVEVEWSVEGERAARARAASGPA